MPAPLYNDIGKVARDILNNGYPFGLIKLDCAAKSVLDGISVNLGSVYTLETNKLGGYIGAKANTESLGYGIKYSADLVSEGEYFQANSLTADASATDHFLKVSTDCAVDPTSGEVIGGHIKNVFRDDYIAMNLDTDVKMGGPFLLEAAASIEWEKFVAGYQLGYDATANTITKNNFALEYCIDEITISGRVENQNVFGVGVGCKVNGNVDVACDVSWSKEDSKTSGAIGARHDISDVNGTIRAKINSDIGFGLSYTQVLHDNITATVCALVDCKNITGDDANHKVGLAVEFQI